MENEAKLILDNERLIYSIANHFKNYTSREDLYQAGCLGLIKAYKKYGKKVLHKVLLKDLQLELELKHLKKQ